MHIRSKGPILRALVAALTIGLLAAASVGCKKSPDDHLRAAKGAVVHENPDEAQPHLEAVLKADPDNFQAKRLMGQVEQLRGNYAKAEEQIKGLWDKQGFGKEGAKLSTQQKSQKNNLEQDLTDLYQAWAESIDQQENPDKFEEVVKKGLAIDPKKPVLNTMLVSFYENRAKKLVEQDKKLEAAKAWESILDLRTLPSKRKKAKERATNLRFEVNEKQMQKYFDEKAKAKLEKADRYDAEKDAILFDVQQDVDEVEAYIKEKKGQRVRLDPRNKKMQPIIHQYTIQKALKPALIDVVVEATGIPEDSDFSKIQAPQGFEIVEVEPTRRDYTIKARIPVQAVLKMGYEIKEQTRKDKEKAKDADKKGEAKDAKAEADTADKKDK